VPSTVVILRTGHLICLLLAVAVCMVAMRMLRILWARRCRTRCCCWLFWTACALTLLLQLQRQLPVLLRLGRTRLQLLCMCAGNKLARRHEGDADVTCAKAQDVLSAQDIVVVLRL
jgi:hypothetical protein